MHKSPATACATVFLNRVSRGKTTGSPTEVHGKLKPEPTFANAQTLTNNVQKDAGKTTWSILGDISSVKSVAAKSATSVPKTTTAAPTPKTTTAAPENVQLRPPPPVNTVINALKAASEASSSSEAYPSPQKPVPTSSSKQHTIVDWKDTMGSLLNAVHEEERAKNLTAATKTMDQMLLEKTMDQMLLDATQNATKRTMEEMKKRDDHTVQETVKEERVTTIVVRPLVDGSHHVPITPLKQAAPAENCGFKEYYGELLNVKVPDFGALHKHLNRKARALCSSVEQVMCVDIHADRKYRCAYSDRVLPGSRVSREHIVPRSWFVHPAKADDLHNLFVTAQLPNSTRSNYVLGFNAADPAPIVVDGGVLTKHSNSPYFWPQHNIGAACRATLYAFVKVANFVSTKRLATHLELIRWHALHQPVSDWERTRNNRIARVQNVRNPFVDFPSWAEMDFDGAFNGEYVKNKNQALNEIATQERWLIPAQKAPAPAESTRTSSKKYSPSITKLPTGDVVRILKEIHRVKMERNEVKFPPATTRAKKTKGKGERQSKLRALGLLKD